MEPAMADALRAAAASGLMVSSSDGPSRLVPASERRVSTLPSQPNAIATTASNTAAPNARLIHSPVPRERFKPANTRPPARIAIAREVAAPAAYANNNAEVWAFGPEIAAPVRTRPRIGPAQGAHKNPVATPSSSEAAKTPFASPAA